MPPRPASRQWGGRNHFGGSRAAEPVANVAALTIEPGPAFIARLRAALATAPEANRYLVEEVLAESPSPSWGGPGRGSSVTVRAIPVSDTCKEVVGGVVRRTIPRDSLVTITGPWLFTREALNEGLARIEGREAGISGLVDFSETARLKVQVVLGT